MIISKLKLKNFMAYYGELDFEFPLNNEKNVSIIYAPNDTGKSCFFKSILFALYGAQHGENLKDFVNINALNENPEAYVSIFGEHNGKDIQITRSIIPRNSENNNFKRELEIFENGEPLIFNDYKLKYSYINSIVHENASKYFFFDGEKIEAYNIASNNDYKEAITRILGIKEIENAKSDFIRLEKEYENKRDNLFEERQEAKEIIDKKNELEDEISILKEDVQDYNVELKEINDRIINLEDELKDHEEVQKKVERKQYLRKEINNLKQKIKEIENKKLETFKKNGTIVLGVDIADNLKRKKNIQSEIYNSYQESDNLKLFIEHLKKEDDCVCGNAISEEEIDNINEYLESFAEYDEEYLREKEINHAFNKINDYIKHAAGIKKEYLDICTKKVELQRELNNLDEEFIELQKDIGSFDEETAAIIGEEITRLESNKEDLKEKRIAKNIKIKEKEEKLNELKKELSKFSETNEQFKLAEKKLEKAKNIKNIFTEYLEGLTKSKKVEVEEKSTDVFMQLTNKKNKYKGLVLTDNYDLKIQLNDGTKYTIEPGNPHNPSTGQSKIISLSYIAGINKTSESQAPIIIDNPLGLFSSEHRRRVTEYIPNFGKQVIFMVTTADLGEEYKQIIEPFINVEYYLEDKSEVTWNKTIIAEKVVK
ncbi:MAG: AAA family ATPase [Candidatus Woesearchaeota archaeon]